MFNTMLFHSVPFLVFFLMVFVVYWGIISRSLRWRNLFILGVSYVFYGWWDWRFLILIVISSAVDYGAGRLIHRSTHPRHRLAYLWLSLGVNLGLLGMFKYFNFFVASFVATFERIGIHLHPVTLNVILPVGISFYTFQTLSYTIDIYRRQFTPTRDIVAFFAFVSFFPQLVAGPIERARHLLPQFHRLAEFDADNGRDACRQILWGLFKKVMIADGLASSADWVFQAFPDQNGSTLVIGAVFFAFQIYGDFSGYSDMAIGLARLLGFDLTQNFNVPYFSRNIAEFWRRWHISLSTWFRDYVFVPLGGSYPQRTTQQRVALQHARNIVLTFVISGLWHGAHWKFVVWGAFHALLYLPLLVMGRPNIPVKPVATYRSWSTPKELLQIVLTFALVSTGWIFFRANTVTEALQYIGRIVSEPWLTQGIPTPNYNSVLYEALRPGLQSIAFLIVVEWWHRDKAHGLALSERVPTPVRWGLYYVLMYLIMVYADTPEPFIYFQF